MKAVVYDRHGGPEVLRYETVPDPVCHPKGVLIRVEAISIEGGDLLDRSGNFAPLGSEPLVMGRQAAGRIIEVADQVEGLEVGQRVVAVRPNGSNAEFFAAPARTVWPVPDRLDLIRAATVPIAFGTAHEALFHYAQLQRGETVLVHGGGGAVGQAAIQFARRHGAGLIIATGSDSARLASLDGLGLDQALNHQACDVAAEVLRLTDGPGAPVIVDAIGGPMMQALLSAAGRGGRIIAVGQASRQPVVVSLADLYRMGLTLKGLKLDIASSRVHAAITAALNGCAAGDYVVAVDRTYPLSEAAAAHRHIESRRAAGRTVLLP